jgi:gamma-glutamyltranspeptidase
MAGRRGQEHLGGGGFDTEELIEMGHEVERRDAIHFGGAQAVCRLPDGNYTGGSDPRKDGLLLLEDIT